MTFDRTEKIGFTIVVGVFLLFGGAFLFQQYQPSTPEVVDVTPLPSAPAPVEPVRKDRFPLVIERVLKHEGGATYTNHPNDPGGPTKYGITIHDVRRFVKANATASDVKNLTRETALDIYRKAYWDALHAGSLPVGVDYVVSDYGINAGISRSGKVLRRAVGLSDATAAVTKDVVAAANAMDPRMLIAMISQERMRFQMGLPKKFNVFKKGWKRRINEVEAAALRDLDPLAVGAFGDHVTPAPGKTPSFVEDQQ